MVLKKTKDLSAKSSAKTVPTVLKSAEVLKTKSISVSDSNGSILSINYPTNGETLKGIHYSIRLEASGNGKPQISFDGNEWKDCRNSSGYWWFDWSYFTPGSYKISARLIDDSGKILKKAVTKCRVE